MSGSYFPVLTVLPLKTMKNNPKAAHSCCKTYRRLPTQRGSACKVKPDVCQIEALGEKIFQRSDCFPEGCADGCGSGVFISPFLLPSSPFIYLPLLNLFNIKNIKAERKRVCAASITACLATHTLSEIIIKWSTTARSHS